MTTITLYLRLVLGTAVVLAPGFVLARALGVRGVAATLAWSLTMVFAALAATFALSASLTFTLALLGIAGIAALGVYVTRTSRLGPPVPGAWWAAGLGAVLGLMLWRVAGTVQGDGLFHLARTRKLVELDDLSLHAIGEFVDASLHPGYAFPLWHGFLGLVTRISGADPEQVVLHLPSVLAPLAILVAYEAGWAVFRRIWAAGAVAGAQACLVCFAPGNGGAYTVLSLPATASDQLLVPAAIALAFETLRVPSSAKLATVAAAGFVLAVVHPTYAIFLWVPFVGYLLTRSLWTRSELRMSLVVLGALAVPAALFMLWLVPIVSETVSVSPSQAEVERAFDQYAGQLDVRSPTSYSLAPEVFTRRGAVAIAALLLIVLAPFAARRRWSAYVVGGSLAVFAVTLIPPLFTLVSDVTSISQARRLASFLPFAFAFAGGFGVLSRIVGPLLPSIALVAGAVLQFAFPGDFSYVLDDPGPAWVVWVAVVGAAVGLVVGLVRKGPTLESVAGFAAGLFLLPVVAVGIVRWTPEDPPPASLLSPGLVDAVRAQVPPRSIVYSDQETSFRIGAAAPVYIAVAPPGHVANTETNRPFERADDARRFLRTGDLSIPESYDADYLVVDRLKMRRDLGLQELYRDPRFVLYRMPAR